MELPLGNFHWPDMSSEWCPQSDSHLRRRINNCPSTQQSLLQNNFHLTQQLNHRQGRRKLQLFGNTEKEGTKYLFEEKTTESTYKIDCKEITNDFAWNGQDYITP